ncbi:hypothetical protein PHYBOEH_000149 [Phytophthora boehmeriae]|uniref:Uncharacterized protein n=1 Tax=Phytophthora boehmeriae TaxID=109152 RepID=A0A8T1X679_9STRA|nr:hypothetical protein PHYBOEH_000149 [Phytophthora boehmeriae]
MSESSSSSALPHGRSESPTWPTDQVTQLVPHRSVMRTTEKSVMFRVRMEEKISDGRGKSEERHSVSSNNSSSNSSKRMLRLPPSGTVDTLEDSDVHEMLAELYAEVERKKQWLNREEDALQQGQEQLRSLKQKHRALMDTLEQCKWRRREKARIQKMLRGPESDNGDCYSETRSSGSESDSECGSNRSRKSRRRSSSRHKQPKDGARKERKRLRRFQSEVSLRFQLLQSECRRADLKVEKAIADVRREYADSCLFGNTLNF